MPICMRKNCWEDLLLGDDGSPAPYCALFTLSNDSIKTKLMPSNDKNRFQRNIVNPKRGRSYPAVLIGRLGVNRDFQNSPSHVVDS